MPLILYLVFLFGILSGCSKTLNVGTLTLKQNAGDPDIYVDIYNPEKTWAGTTLFADYHRPERPRIIEVNMQGQIVWEYMLTGYLRQYTNPGFDVEWLPNNNIIICVAA